MSVCALPILATCRCRSLCIFSSFGVMALTIAAAWLLPERMAAVFDGPEGVRWVGPLILWMGFLSAALVAFLPRLKRVFGFTEAVVALVIMILFLGLIAFIAAQRLTSGLRPYESYNAHMALRLASGAPLYADPEAYPIGTIYTPFYYVLSALLYKILPGQMSYGRIISFGATIATAFLVFRIAAMKSRSVITGLWGAALFIATYGIMGKLYDAVIIEPLLMCLLTASLFFFLKRTPGDDLFALFFAGLACFTKQSALFAFLAVGGGVIAARRKAWVFSPLLFWLAVTGVMVVGTGGRAWEYLVVYPTHYPPRRFEETRTLLHFFGLQLPLWIGFVHGLIKQRDGRFTLFAAAQLFAVCLHLKIGGGWLGSLAPFEPLLCAGAAAALSAMKPLLTAQLLMGIYNPFGALYPWSAMRDVDARAMRLAAWCREEVWFPVESYLAYAAGKREWDHFGAIESRCWAGYAAPQRLVDALRQQRFGLIVLRQGSYPVFENLSPAIAREIAQRYIRHESDGLIIYRPAGVRWR